MVRTDKENSENSREERTIQLNGGRGDRDVFRKDNRVYWFQMISFSSSISVKKQKWGLDLL